jgi:hypothetical protein
MDRIVSDRLASELIHTLIQFPYNENPQTTIEKSCFNGSQKKVHSIQIIIQFLEAIVATQNMTA